MTTTPGARHHAYPARRKAAPPRTYSGRKPPLRRADQIESIAETARKVDARAVQMRDALVDLAKRGKSPKVATYVREQGWENESAIRERFLVRYGVPPKTYAMAFGACPDCECVAINVDCEHCAERARIQGSGR